MVKLPWKPIFLLSAVGVVANIENIGLEALGIKTDKGKIVVDANRANKCTRYICYW